MGHGTVEVSSASTFSITEEDHTLANSVRFVLNQDPRVAFCGYSIPHPADKSQHKSSDYRGSSQGCPEGCFTGLDSHVPTCSRDFRQRSGRF